MTAATPAPVTTVEAVAHSLGLTESDPEYPDIGPVVDAVCAWVDRYVDGRGPDITHGATMLAARIYRRRSSPAGVEAFGEMGPTYVQRRDPDVAQLLGLGPWARPVVG